jgi:hypothetical protein
MQAVAVTVSIRIVEERDAHRVEAGGGPSTYRISSSVAERGRDLRPLVVHKDVDAPSASVKFART